MSHLVVVTKQKWCRYLELNPSHPGFNHAKNKWEYSTVWLEKKLILWRICVAVNDASCTYFCTKIPLYSSQFLSQFEVFRQI